ncbi:glycosyltransferase [Planococcus plakortidis]
MKKKSILFVVNNFNIGGPQKSLLSLIYNLDSTKYDIDLISLSNEGELLKYMPDKVRIVRAEESVSYSILPRENIIGKSIKMLLMKKYKNVGLASIAMLKGFVNKKMVQEKQKYWVKVKGELPKRTKEYDYAFGVSGGHSMMFVADCIKARKKIGWIRSDYRVLKRDLNIDEKYFNEMDLILSVSEICKDIFLEIFPENKKKTQVFYNLLPFKMYSNLPAVTSQMDINSNALKLLTICRLDPHKGLDLALDTLKLLNKKGINVKWFVLGEGTYRKELEQLIADKKLEDSFILLGFQLNTAEFIKKADIIVHPSKFEGKSNVVDEAKYLLKPIVATKYNTVEEQLTHGVTGLIAEMNAESILENILLLKTSPDLKRKLEINLKNQRIDKSRNVSEFENIINK